MVIQVTSLYRLVVRDIQTITNGQPDSARPTASLPLYLCQNNRPATSLKPSPGHYKCILDSECINDDNGVIDIFAAIFVEIHLVVFSPAMRMDGDTYSFVRTRMKLQGNPERILFHLDHKIAIFVITIII